MRADFASGDRALITRQHNGGQEKNGGDEKTMHC